MHRMWLDHPVFSTHGHVLQQSHQAASRLEWPALAPLDAVLAPLQVNLNLESKSSNVRKANKKAMLAGAGADYRRKTGPAFSADTPYEETDDSDTRQFTRM